MVQQELSNFRERAPSLLLCAYVFALALGISLTPFFLSEHGLFAATISVSQSHPSDMADMADMPAMPEEHGEHFFCLRCVLVVMQAPVAVKVSGVGWALFVSAIPHKEPVPRLSVRGIVKARAPPNFSQVTT